MGKSDEAAILALIEARNAAVHAGATEQAVALLADDVVAYGLQPPLRFVGPAWRDADGMAQWLATWDGPVRIEMCEPTITVDGDLALAHGLSHMRGTKRDGGPVHLWYRTTLGLKRVAGTWSIVHEHHSVPMMMDGSGLAAVDLTPEDPQA